MMHKLWPRTRKSHPLSKLLRPLFEGKKPKKNFGVLLVFVVLLSGFFVPPASSLEAYQEEELVTLVAEIEVETQEEAKLPFKLSQDCYISQGFWYLHPAIDIAAPRGTVINSIMPGKIIFTGYQAGYGKTVIIDHGNNLTSLYAHLSKIEVENEEEVTQETIIGRVGSTGFATGNHLHLEVQENSRYLNPKAFLDNLNLL